MNKKDKLVQEFVVIFWLFIIGSVIGYIFEIAMVLFRKGYIESRRGLIYGPFTPVYGVGIIIYYLVLKNIKSRNKIKVFFITMLLGGIIEYLCSFLQEKLFGTISWDYSNIMFNINGRTSLLHCTYWGMGGILYISFIEPLIEEIRKTIIKKDLQIITVLLVCFMAFDISISFLAAERQTDRRNHIMPHGKVDIFLDKHYSDEYMDKIYANKKEIKK